MRDVMERCQMHSATAPSWTYYIWYAARLRTSKIVVTSRETGSKMPREGNETWKLIAWAERGHIVFV